MYSISASAAHRLATPLPRCASARGCYVGHGETYLHTEDILWWSKGGVLHGQAEPRIRFLKGILEEGPAFGIDPVSDHWNVTAAGVPGDYYLHYFDAGQPRRKFIELPDDTPFTAELIDAWRMTIETLPGTYSGRVEIPLPGRSYIALRARRVPVDASI